MTENLIFRELMRRVRQGDQLAVAELVRKFGPALLVAAGVHLNDPDVRRIFDPDDAVQDVLKVFFTKTILNLKSNLCNPRQLYALLLLMTSHKCDDLRDLLRCQKRDPGPVDGSDTEMQNFTDPHVGDPRERAENKERYEKIIASFTEEERELVMQWLEFDSFAEVGRRTGLTAKEVERKVKNAFEKAKERFPDEKRFSKLK